MLLPCSLNTSRAPLVLPLCSFMLVVKMASSLLGSETIIMTGMPQYGRKHGVYIVGKCIFRSPSSKLVTTTFALSGEV